jgi:FKBP-type peptidyl-prolyl cis-trans isomerase
VVSALLWLAFAADPCAVDIDRAVAATPSAAMAYACAYELGESHRRVGVRAEPLMVLKACYAAAIGHDSAFSRGDIAIQQSIAHRTGDPAASLSPAWAALPRRLDLDQAEAIDRDTQAMAYALGYVVGVPYARLGLTVDWQGFTLGYLHARYARADALGAEARARAILAMDELVRQRQAQQSAAAARDGEAFRARFAAAPGVIDDGGALYRIIDPGTGSTPGERDVVRVRYRAMRIDGSELEATPGEHPVDLPMPGLLPGLRQVLARLRAGSEVEIVLPGALARGSDWSTDLPGNATLRYRLSLVDVVPYARIVQPPADALGN